MRLLVPAAVRPIAIASSTVRAWSRSLLRPFHLLPEDPWCGTAATVPPLPSLLGLALPASGSEFDLRRALDNVDHGSWCSFSDNGLFARRHLVFSSPFCVVEGEPPRHSVVRVCVCASVVFLGVASL